jgi:hypothetical protein
MKVTLAFTPRLIMISSVCICAICILLVMMGFELGLRQAQSEQQSAQAQAVEPTKSAVSYSPVVLPSASTVLYGATAPGAGK